MCLSSSCPEAPQEKEFESHLLSRVRRWRHARRALSLDVLMRFAKEPRPGICEQPALVFGGVSKHTTTCTAPPASRL
jgi:hypothetical protein